MEDSTPKFNTCLNNQVGFKNESYSMPSFNNHTVVKYDYKDKEKSERALKLKKQNIEMFADKNKMFYPNENCSWITDSEFKEYLEKKTIYASLVAYIYYQNKNLDVDKLCTAANNFSFLSHNKLQSQYYDARFQSHYFDANMGYGMNKFDRIDRIDRMSRKNIKNKYHIDNLGISPKDLVANI